MDYTQVDPATRLAAVQNRIRELETQYMNLELRVQAPDVNTPPGNMDAQNLERLGSSLSTLRSMEAQLKGESPAATTA